MAELRQMLEAGMKDPEAGWNMGSFGAIAEFHHVAGDPVPVQDADLTQVTDRGGVRIDRLEGVRPIAYEMLTARADRWAQAVSLCLPQEAAAMNRRAALTELGPDADALRPADRAACLFDMGLAQMQVDFCIRTEDAALLKLLRAQVGRSILEPGNPVMPAILQAHPHRVALTRVGRVEVYQKIGGPDTGGRSPEGPHTHVLPKLLRSGRTHSANAPIPDGWVPCAGFHPENPVMGRLAEDKPFDRASFDAFQELLQAWGPPDYLSAKAACWQQIARHAEPDTMPLPSTRFARAGLRNGLRQWLVLHGPSPLLRRWQAVFDASGLPDDDMTEPENPGH